MKIRHTFLFALLGVFFLTPSCDKDEDIVFPEYPQDKLQFSKVVYVELDTLHPGCGDCTLNIALSKTITVDSNKVLKIESINHVGTTGLTDGDIFFNRLIIDASNSLVVFPIWVPAGEYNLEIKISGDYGAFPSRQITAMLSGVEYEIIQ